MRGFHQEMDTVRRAVLAFKDTSTRSDFAALFARNLEKVGKISVDRIKRGEGTETLYPCFPAY